VPSGRAASAYSSVPAASRLECAGDFRRRCRGL
jgi:hypothetical protein